MVSSALNMVIMLNLLISIIGDTFDRVLVFRDITDGLVKIDCILEIYQLKWRNRDKSDMKFIKVCKPHENEQQDDMEKLMRREMKGLKRQVKQLTQGMERIERLLER